MAISGRVLVSAIMLAIFAGMVLMAATYPAKAGFLPLVIGIPGTILCLVQLLIDSRAVPAIPPPEEGRGEAHEAPSIRAELALFGWLVVFLAGILLFGFQYGTPILLFLYLYFAGRESLLTSVVVATVGYVFVYVVFVHLLALSLFEGFLFDLRAV